MGGHWGQLEAIPMIGCEMSYSFWSAGGAVVPWDRLEPFSEAAAPADRRAFPDGSAVALLRAKACCPGSPLRWKDRWIAAPFCFLLALSSHPVAIYVFLMND